MKTLLTLFFFVLCLTHCNAQTEGSPIEYLNHITFDKCDSIPFNWDDDSYRISYPTGNRHLSDYFIEHVPDQKLLYFTGKVFIQIILNRQGKCCCKSIFLRQGSMVLEQFKMLKLDQLIDAMPEWSIKKPVSPDKNGGNYLITPELEFFGDGSISVDYNPHIRRMFITSVKTQSTIVENDSNGKLKYFPLRNGYLKLLPENKHDQTIPFLGIFSKEGIVYAMEPGIVVDIIPANNSYYITIKEQGNKFTIYGNFETVKVQQGDEINRGQDIGILKKNKEDVYELYFASSIGHQMLSPEALRKWVLARQYL